MRDRLVLFFKLWCGVWCDFYSVMMRNAWMRWLLAWCGVLGCMSFGRNVWEFVDCFSLVVRITKNYEEI